uniref:Integrase core domain-containing protein n=2 Tax=Candidatus Kentrum sp. LPFa TaxID=2126335 RepID=A0A450Y546_9GAMM|nr:MAG: hypothetical protein BECKLPF1236C_GA0070990_106601 [Candidatus Kentron sp. LPFa]
MRKGRLAEGIRREGLILHSDNGSPMRGATMLARATQIAVIRQVVFKHWLLRRKMPIQAFFEDGGNAFIGR